MIFKYSSADNALNLLARLFSRKKIKEPEREIKMCVIGLDNAGKTTILRALSREEI